LKKNQNFGEKNKNCDQKWQFWRKIEILEKNRNFAEKSKFWGKSNFSRKIEIF